MLSLVTHAGYEGDDRCFFLYNLSIFFCNVAAFIFCMNHQGYAYSLKQNYEFAKYRIICTRSKKQKRYYCQCIFSQIQKIPFSKNIWVSYIIFIFSCMHASVKYDTTFQYMHIDTTTLITHFTFLRCFQANQGITFHIHL